MATRTRAPLDQGFLNGLGGTFFKQLADGRWACFFLFGGKFSRLGRKKGRILPSEATGRLFRRVASASILLGGVAMYVGLVQAGRWVAANDPTMHFSPVNFSLILAAGVAAGAVPVSAAALWLRRRSRHFPIADETLSPGEHRYQTRHMNWIGLLAALVMCFEAGKEYARHQNEFVDAVQWNLAGGIIISSILIVNLNLIIRAARRRAPTQTASR